MLHLAVGRLWDMMCTDYAHGFSSFLLTSVPDSPHEPDPEPYEPMPPRLIPLDEVSTCLSHTL